MSCCYKQSTKWWRFIFILISDNLIMAAGVEKSITYYWMPKNWRMFILCEFPVLKVNKLFLLLQAVKSDHLFFSTEFLYFLRIPLLPEFLIIHFKVIASWQLKYFSVTVNSSSHNYVCSFLTVQVLQDNLIEKLILFLEKRKRKIHFIYKKICEFNADVSSRILLFKPN